MVEIQAIVIYRNQLDIQLIDLNKHQSNVGLYNENEFIRHRHKGKPSHNILVYLKVLHYTCIAFSHTMSMTLTMAEKSLSFSQSYSYNV